MSRPSPITAARARHTLAEVAARTGVDAYRTGGSVSVRCPFPSHGHPDRTPSLRLHLDAGIFSCFGCGAKGDAVEWVRLAEGVDWREAIAILDAGRPFSNAWAGKAPSGYERSPGVPARTAAGAESAGQPDAADLARTPPERVHAALDAAWGYYTQPGLRARGEEYLWGRGIVAGRIGWGWFGWIVWGWFGWIVWVRDTTPAGGGLPRPASCGTVTWCV